MLPAACERLLGERLESAGVSTRWPSDRLTLDAASAEGGGLIKSAFPNMSMEPVFVDDLDEAGRELWAARFGAAPDAYVVEERLPLSHAPSWHDGRLQSRALMLRVFLAADGHGDYTLMPGGLSRIAADGRPIVSTQRGGSSKDTWVLSDPDGHAAAAARRAPARTRGPARRERLEPRRRAPLLAGPLRRASREHRAAPARRRSPA